MDLVDAFLIFTSGSYFVSAIVPYKVIRGGHSRSLERVLLMLMGLLLIADLVLNSFRLWIMSSAIWTASAVMSYLGYVEWNVSWRKDASELAQMVMFVWDALIAVSCLLKV